MNKGKKLALLGVLAVAVCIVLFGVFCVFNNSQTRTAEKFLNVLFTATDTQSAVLQDSAAMEANYSDKYMQYFTQRGFKAALENRVFSQPATYTEQTGAALTLQKVTFTLFSKNAPGQYRFTLTAQDNAAPQQTVSYTGNIVLVKVEGAQHIDSISLQQTPQAS